MSNIVSIPPLSSDKPPKTVTFADVAMKLAQDGPIYAILGVVGAMAYHGHADAKETIITGLSALLARMWPQAVQVAGKVGAHVVIFLAAAGAFTTVHACSAPVHRSVDYGFDLKACNESAKTCHDSIVCENVVRAREGRPARDVDAGCE